MKKSFFVFTILSLIFFISCTNKKQSKIIIKVQNKGRVIVENGKGILDTINYTCTGCEENIKDTTTFNSLIKMLTKETREKLNYPLSFLPKSLDITVAKEDSLFYFKNSKKIENAFSVLASYKYIAKNGYGNELEGETFISNYMLNGKITDLSEEIKLDSLRFDGNFINRNLKIYSQSNHDKIEIMPTNTKSLIVTSSLGCVDKGAWLIITLYNGEKIELVSWNDFNCEGTCYFDIKNKNQREKLLSSKIAMISLVDKESISCSVPTNETDYFIQLVKLLN